MSCKICDLIFRSFSIDWLGAQRTAPACTSLEFTHVIIPVGTGYVPDMMSLGSGWVGVLEQRLKRWWEI